MTCKADGDHTGTVRPYLCGPRCDRHAPWAVAGRVMPSPPPHGLTPLRAPVPPPRRRPMDDAPSVPADVTGDAAAVVARLMDRARSAPAAVDDPYARPGATPTSNAAAVKVLPKTGTQRRAIFDALVSAAHAGGATDPELSRHLGLSGNSVRPRRGELVEMGLVEDSGRTRLYAGNPHIVWRPTQHGIVLAHRARA